MKKILILTILTTSLFTIIQAQTKTLDYIYLENGDTIETRLIRVNNRKIHYTDPRTFQIVEISQDDVKNYEYNDEFFQTNLLGELAHSEVVPVEGYNSDEIYRAIKDWFFVNSKKYLDGIILEDIEHFIIVGTISTPNYSKLDFATFMSMLDEKTGEVSYSLNYDVNVRVKDNRFKIYITNFTIQSNYTLYEKALKAIYDKRKTKEGIVTIHGSEIARVKSMIAEQIKDIRAYCENVRLNDTYHNRIVNAALLDDNW